RAVKRANYLAELRQDVGYALRALRGNLGFTVVIVLSLAIGIGANTAIFTLIDALLLRQLPVPNAHELVAVGDRRRVNSASDGSPRGDLYSFAQYEFMRGETRMVTGLAATGRTGRLDVVMGDSGSTARGGAEPEHPRGRLVSGNYFRVLGVPAWIGRTITTDDDRVANGAPVAVISHAYWQRRFGGDRGVIGRVVHVNRTPFTIIGVTPPGFHGEVVGRMSDIWMPLTMQPAIMHRDWLTDRDAAWLLALGRLAPGISLEQAKVGLTQLVRQSLVETAPESRAAREADKAEVPVESGARGFSSLRMYAASLGTLMVAVALVLLVVCANVANLLLARGAARGRELGVRMALGAGRGRLVRQLLTESLILAALGGALGLLFAVWGSRMLLVLSGGAANPIALDVRLDGRVLWFTMGVTALTAILFGLVPAVRATRVDLASTLRSGGRGVASGLLGAPGRLAIGKLLVVAQVSLSLILLVGTSMLVRSTRALGTVDVGLARDQLLIVTVDAAPTGQSGDRLAVLARTLLDRVRALPGVVAASFSENGIFSGTESMTTLQVEGFIARTDEDSSAFYDRVGPGYFSAIGARVLQGRDITANDDERAPRVAVINATMASFYFPRAQAVGRRVHIDSVWYQIVGVVADTKDHELRQAPVRRIYLPVFQSGPLPTQLTFELRTSGKPAQLVTPTRRALIGVHPSLLVLDNDPLTALMRHSIRQDTLVAQVASFFGALALALAALGLYGVMMYATLRRTSEFGLRLALGAEPRRIARMVLRETLVLVVGGTLVGLPVALATARLLRSQLFGVEPLDPPSIVIALTVLVVSAAVAGYAPARRAARVGPLVALRTD
ncbi:MAG TPA: ABC transporter permease, partial [Gemmatimonadaceae bacterium]|nr:ABC transporter permease [Gemmatimonadaceae bacterium]